MTPIQRQALYIALFLCGLSAGYWLGMASRQLLACAAGAVDTYAPLLENVYKELGGT